VIFALAFNVALARRSNKAGTVTDGTYIDEKYAFSIDVPEEWNYSIKKNKSHIRAVLSKKSYDVPIAFQENPTYTKVPKITVMADTSSLTVERFVDSLLNDDYKTKQKKKIIQECEILIGDFAKKKHSKMSVSDVNGVLVTGENKYTMQIRNERTNEVEPYTNYYGGSIFFAKHGDYILMFHFICENLYYKNLHQNFIEIMNTLSLIEEEEEQEEKDK
jgi:hypothetical protein